MMMKINKKIHDKKWWNILTSQGKILVEKISNIKSQSCVQYFSFPKYMIDFNHFFLSVATYFLSKRKFFNLIFLVNIFSSSTNKHFLRKVEREIELRHKE